MTDQKHATCPPIHSLLAAWAPFYAGAEVAAVRLAVGLREVGHRVTVLLGTNGDALQRMREAGLDVHYVPLALTDKFAWWRYRSSQREVRRILQRVNPDIVHANDLPTSQMVGQAAGQLGIPRVCHHRWVFGGSAIDWLNKFGAERHLFVSQALADQLCSASARLARSPMDVVHDGLLLPALPTDADRRDARHKLGLSLDKQIVLFTGQIIARKGIEDLLHAWQKLSPASSACAELILVGDDLEGAGQYRRRMEALAAEIGSPAQFMGFQRNVYEWLTAADICVVPSHVEPLGNATLEAMAHGRPVIGSNVGGIPEMIVHEETGLLTPPNSPDALAGAIERLLFATIRSQFGDAARRRCETLFSLGAHVQAVVKAYRTVLTRSRMEAG